MMWLSNSPDISHTPNLNTTLSHIEKKQDWWNNLNNAIENQIKIAFNKNEISKECIEKYFN